MTMKTCSRILRKSSFRYWSEVRTFSAAAPSRRRSASRAASIWDSTSVPIRTNDSRRLASSFSNVSRGTLLAEPSGDVGLCPAVLRLVEQVTRGRELDEVAVAVLWIHEHERGEVGHARSLLHVVGDDDDRVLMGQLDDEVLDLQRGHRVERRAWLVHEDHLWADCQAPRDHKSLLLSGRARRGRGVVPVRDLVPERGAFEAAADDIGDP